MNNYLKHYDSKHTSHPMTPVETYLNSLLTGQHKETNHKVYHLLAQTPSECILFKVEQNIKLFPFILCWIALVSSNITIAINHQMVPCKGWPLTRPYSEDLKLWKYMIIIVIKIRSTTRYPAYRIVVVQNNYINKIIFELVNKVDTLKI